MKGAHNMRFERMRKAVQEENEKYFRNHSEYIKRSENTLKAESTAARWNNYKSGKADRETTERYAIERKDRYFKKQLEKNLETIKTAENSTPEIESITIFIDWKRNATWGHNPHAEITIDTATRRYTYHGTASGCGYDKRSAAVVSALNDCEMLKSELIEYKEQHFDNMPYGCGVSAIPYFEGGCGESTIETILRELGFDKITDHGTRTTDYYYFERRAAK